jgi:hypothetical protein
MKYTNVKLNILHTLFSLFYFAHQLVPLSNDNAAIEQPYRITA